jgi:hypothetical protein
MQAVSAGRMLEATRGRQDPHNRWCDALNDFGDDNDPWYVIRQHVYHIRLKTQGHDRAGYYERNRQD